MFKCQGKKSSTNRAIPWAFSLCDWTISWLNICLNILMWKAFRAHWTASGMSLAPTMEKRRAHAQSESEIGYIVVLHIVTIIFFPASQCYELQKMESFLWMLNHCVRMIGEWTRGNRPDTCFPPFIMMLCVFFECHSDFKSFSPCPLPLATIVSYIETHTRCAVLRFILLVFSVIETELHIKTKWKKQTLY